MATLAQLLPSCPGQNAIVTCWEKVPEFISSHITAVSLDSADKSEVTVCALFISNEGESMADCHPSEITLLLREVSAWQFASFLQQEDDRDLLREKEGYHLVEGAGFRFLCRAVEVLACKKASLVVPPGGM